MPYRDDKLSPETRGKLRNFYRVLLSYGDFKQAQYIASYILDEKLHDREDRRLLEALNCAMIVAYCRPFSGNDRAIDAKIPDLSVSFLRDLSEAEREIHEVVLRDRNTVVAHSDSIAHDLHPKVLVISGERILMPWKADTRAPLTRDATEIFLALVSRMRDKLWLERMRLEPELLDYFDHMPIEQILKETDDKG
jgi:hypothetical protein